MDRLRIIGITALLLALASCGSTAEDLPSQKPTVTYDAGVCTYEGPESFTVGEGVRFIAVNLSPTNQVGFQVWRVGENVTPAEILEKGIFFVEANWVDLHAVESAAPGFEYPFFVTFASPGRHGINCNDYSMGTPGEDYTVMFTVES
jgi:hypothetical protein